MDLQDTKSLLDNIYNYFRQQKIQYGNCIFLDEGNVIEEKKLNEEKNIKSDNKIQVTKDETPALDLFGEPVPGQKKVFEEWENATSIQELNEMICNCLKCPLGHTRTKFVFGVGNPNADIVFIGEAPGADEDMQGEPFVGRAGQLFNKILDAIKWKREDVYICNILKCRPPGNRDPLTSEVELCEPYLKKQIELIKPIIIVSLGRIAAQTLLRKPSESLTSLRSKIHSYEGIPLLVTFHTAALLRNPNWKPDAWEDFKKLKAMYDNATNKKLI